MSKFGYLLFMTGVPVILILTVLAVSVELFPDRKPVPSFDRRWLPASGSHTFGIRSVDVMQLSQDAVCDPPSQSLVTEVVRSAVTLGATHVAVSVPVDDAWCKEGVRKTSLSLARMWADTVHAYGLNVWFRPKSVTYEGFYGMPRNLDPQYHIGGHEWYILNHPGLFRPGDMYTPNPEPQNAGITGVNCHPEEGKTCLFPDAVSFNIWLRDLTVSVREAFGTIGLAGRIYVGNYGFDGFIGWGDRNPDWNGILEPQTLAVIGDIGLDHYYPSDADPSGEYSTIRSKFPGMFVCVSEWGATGGQSPDYVRRVFASMRAHGIGCVNWWQTGFSGKESLLMLDGNKLRQTEYFRTLQSIYNEHL